MSEHWPDPGYSCQANALTTVLAREEERELGQANALTGLQTLLPAREPWSEHWPTLIIYTDTTNP